MLNHTAMPDSIEQAPHYGVLPAAETVLLDNNHGP